MTSGYTKRVKRKLNVRKYMTTMPKAIKSGYIDLGFGKIPVAVLKDGTRLITTSGFHKALGKSNPSGRKENDTDHMPAFLRPKNLKSIIDNDLTKKMMPIQFSMPRQGKAR